VVEAKRLSSMLRRDDLTAHVARLYSVCNTICLTKAAAKSNLTDFSELKIQT